ncbi:hypothetical protein MML48_3g00004898 [Holotrichia oblita]|uniref:Uncharacterized protein n=1 Tax=Holotrichia oblita TaxID=644536 RepID=A0ACB9TE95_HOLOL|nr:hypothetical protein MML48_3g00004898 [Holotrichia oblita]
MGHFYILTSLIPPTSRISRKKVQHWKPSTAESRESFINHVKSASDIYLSIYKKKENAIKYGLQVQPYVMVVGPSINTIINTYMVIDDNIYKVTSVLRGVDICFKTFHVLQAHYPVESEHLWLFLQKYIFNISTAWDKNIPALNTFIAELSHINKVA